MKEKKLLSKIKQKDKDAFMIAYDLYVNDIHRFVYFKTGSTEEANDITSTVFLKTWKYIVAENLDREKSLKALIYKIARNTVIDYYRQTNNKEIGLEGDFENGKTEVVDDKQDVLKKLEINSDFVNVEKALSKLKDEYREIITMRFINELSFAEIALIVGKSKGNVRVLSHRALEALRELMKDLI